MQVKPKIETYARIKVLGVGGSGTNAFTECGTCINGVEFIAINTDAQALRSKADKSSHRKNNHKRSWCWNESRPRKTSNGRIT